MTVQKNSKKRKSFKTILKDSIRSFYGFGNGIHRKKPAQRFEISHKFNYAGTLEVHHSLYNEYCPKWLHFSYKCMVACSQLAVLDFNAGVGLKQVETKLGELRFKQQFSKVTQSLVAKKIISKKDKIYLNHLMDEVVHLKLSKEEYSLLTPKNVPKNLSLVEKPYKKQSTNTMRTRFSV